MQSTPLLDLAIIGGGVAGVIHLHYARQAGLEALLLEREGGVGGLWRRLPVWQDIQISPADWTVGDLPLTGARQPDILANIEAWVERFDLADRIRLDSAVSRARHTGTCWELETPQGNVRARHLVAATGGHNTPAIPDVHRVGSEVRELHSSAVREPAGLSGREVLVVGGGASAFDLLELCLAQGARRIAWAYRGLRWFTPTGKPKTVAGSVRPYAKMQASGMSAAQQNAMIGADLLARYEKFGIQSIRPERPLDVRHDQLIPGRAGMLARFGALERHAGSVEAIEGRQVTLSNGQRVTADLLLWGTGYRTDLSYFEVPRIARIRSVGELASRCGCIFRSLDAPDLYFPGVGLDGIGSAPWSFMVMARSVVSHIRGTAQLDMEPVADRLNHFDIVRHLAARDAGSYAGDRGWDFYRALAMDTPDDRPYPLL